jgi:uncharacterized tellurite resistance protein B-like protein
VRTIVAAAVALGIALAACGTSDVERDTFRSALRENTDLRDGEVDCVVRETYEALDQEAINDLYTAADREDLPDRDEQRFEAIVEDCVPT